MFDEQGGKTTVTTTVLYESKEARDAVLKSPMEQGVAAGYDRLDEILASQAGREPEVTAMSRPSPATVAKHGRRARGFRRGRRHCRCGHGPVCTCSMSIRPGGSRCTTRACDLLALAYRSVYAVLGSYIAARLAPHAPMRHAVALGSRSAWC